MRTIFAMLLLLWTAIPLVAQETERRVEGPGNHTKFLTPGQMDRWILKGEAGETLVVHVKTTEFDPILQLAAGGSADDPAMFSVDDEGSEARFAVRLPKTGEYAVRVHAFKFRGGGNYALSLRRFNATSMGVDKPVVGAFDRNGKGFYYFTAEADQLVTVDLQGGSQGGWELLDPKGKRADHWIGVVRIEKAGEHSLIVSGRPGHRYQLRLHDAPRRRLAEGKDTAGKLQPGRLDVWAFDAQPGRFRLLEVTGAGRLRSRLVYVPEKKADAPRIRSAGQPPEMRFLPVSSKGGRLRHAVVLGRRGRYELHVMAESAAEYGLKLADPSRPIQIGKPHQGELPVGGSAFFTLRAAPGRLLEARLASGAFDPLLRLYDSAGELLEQNDDGGDQLGSRITRLILKEGDYRLQVASLGDGGGGRFTLSLSEQKLKEIAVGGRGKGSLASRDADFWSFVAKEGTTVLLSVRSEACDPAVTVFGPDGVALAADNDGGVGADSLLALRLPKTGRYTIRVDSRRGAGPYTLRVIDGD